MSSEESALADFHALRQGFSPSNPRYAKAQFMPRFTFLQIGHLAASQGGHNLL